MTKELTDDKAILRARDVWGAAALMIASAFLLWKTFDIPLWGGNRAGISSADWYNSAAIVPLGIFGAMFVLSCIMLGVALRAGGGPTAFKAVGIGWNRHKAIRFSCLAIILTSYIAGLVPRVDFILASGLLITALIYGFYGGEVRRISLASVAVFLPGAYAFIRYLPQSEWGALDDDWVTLAIWVLLTGWVIAVGRGDKVLRAVPWIVILAPVILVTAMAFGFRQNVPNRGGLLFKQIEYHYFVTLRPLWRS